jgi:DNA-binding NarL/FixJ family response regulator
MPTTRTKRNDFLVRVMPLRTKAITILIADDHPLTRAGIRTLLEKAPDLKIVGEVGDSDRIEAMVGELRPDILLLDLVMPHHPPARIEEWVRANYPATITLVLTAHDSDAHLSSMMKAGAAGCLDNRLGAEQLIAAIRRAADGMQLFDDEQAARVLRWRGEVEQRWESLTPREREVLQLVAAGKDNKTIAGLLGITINTTEKYLTEIYEKLGVSSRTEAVRWWQEGGTDFRTGNLRLRGG